MRHTGSQPRESNRDAEFLRLLGSHDARLAACVHTIVPRWQDAEDILQETRLALWREFETFQAGSNFLAWARTVARYTALAHFQKKKTEGRVFSDEVVEALMARAVQTPEEESRLWTALQTCSSKLGSAARELVRLVYVDNKKIKAVAEQTGRSVNGT